MAARARRRRGLGLATGLAIVDALPVGVVADDAFYVILARALATGQGYHVLNVPGHPAGTHFPPGYPALLALLSFVAPAFPASVAAFKAFNAVFLAASAVLVARLLRMRLDMGAGWCRRGRRGDGGERAAADPEQPGAVGAVLPRLRARRCSSRSSGSSTSRRRPGA